MQDDYAIDRQSSKQSREHETDLLVQGHDGWGSGFLHPGGKLLLLEGAVVCLGALSILLQQHQRRLFAACMCRSAGLSIFCRSVAVDCAECHMLLALREAPAPVPRCLRCGTVGQYWHGRRRASGWLSPDEMQTAAAVCGREGSSQGHAWQCPSMPGHDRKRNIAKPSTHPWPRPAERRRWCAQSRSRRAGRWLQRCTPQKRRPSRRPGTQR